MKKGLRYHRRWQRMGLATAKLVCEEGYYTILVGRTASKLEKAVNDLRSAGGEAEAFTSLWMFPT